MKEKKILWGDVINIVFSILAGAYFSIHILVRWELEYEVLETMEKYGVVVVLCLIGFWTSSRIQIILHEFGHFVFGIASGYKFVSFRVGKRMLVKTNGKLQLKKIIMPGTDGQCLMEPGGTLNGKIPYVLYNMGGVLCNVISARIFLYFESLFSVFYMIKPAIGFVIVKEILYTSAVMGGIYALLNGIPLRLSLITNDGYNVISMIKKRKEQEAFWVQLKVNALLAKGYRLKDLPNDWFYIPDDSSFKKRMSASIGVLACNRLMDSHLFIQADQMIEEVLKKDTGIVGLERNNLILDRIYCQLLQGRSKDVLDECLGKKAGKFMKQNNKNLSLCRTQYAYALLVNKDTASAEQIKNRFEKMANTYPYAGELQMERELMEIVEKIMHATS